MIAHLYQYVFGHQQHYVVACGLGDAEATILSNGYTRPERIVDLGPYVYLSEAAIEESRRRAKEET